MTTAAAPARLQDEVPEYFLVPVRSNNDVTLSVWYYKALSDTQWTRVSAKELKSYDCAQVVLRQATESQIIECTNLRAEDLDLTVDLYVAVARNLLGPDTLPNSYTADKGAVTIDVSMGIDMTRALILVFTKSSAPPSAETVDIEQLMSTTEPEIKNGVGAGERPRA